MIRWWPATDAWLPGDGSLAAALLAGDPGVAAGDEASDQDDDGKRGEDEPVS